MGRGLCVGGGKKIQIIMEENNRLRFYVFWFPVLEKRNITASRGRDMQVACGTKNAVYTVFRGHSTFKKYLKNTNWLVRLSTHRGVRGELGLHKVSEREEHRSLSRTHGIRLS